MSGKGVQLGFLKYVLGFDTLAFKKGVASADADLVKLQRKFASQGKAFQSLGKSLSLYVTAPLAAFAAEGIKEAKDMAAAMAQVDAALKSTGGAAGVTGEQLKKASEGFELKSLYEDDQILKDVSSRLLAFGNIHGATFLRAQQAIVDYATRSGKSLGDATTIIGRALNNPAKAFGRLERAGVSLTDSQKALIINLQKTGDVAGAQAALLGVLESKYKGAAAAAQQADPWNALHDAFRSIAQSLGTLLLPLIPPLAAALSKLAGWVSSLSPPTQKWVVGIAAAAAVLGPLLIIVGNAVVAISALAPVVTALAAGWGLLTAGLTALVPVLGLVADALLGLLANPIILGAAVVILGIYEAWKHWDAIKGFVAGVYNAVKNYIVDKVFPWIERFKPLLALIAPAALLVYEAFTHWREIAGVVASVYTAVKTWLVDKLNAVWDWVHGKIKTVTADFKAMYDAVVGHSYVPDMVREIGDWFAKLAGNMVAPAKDAVGQTNAAFAGLDPALPGGGSANIPTIDIAPFSAANDDMAEKAKMTSADVIKAYGDMATGALEKMRDFAQQIKQGDILGAIESVLQVVQSVLTTLGQTGVIALPGGAGATPRASGGPVVPGRTYLVGENGPEYVRFGSRGYVTPNNKTGGGAGGRVTIVPSPYFDVVVDDRASAVAAPMAGRAAFAGAVGGAGAVYHRAARRIP